MNRVMNKVVESSGMEIKTVLSYKTLSFPRALECSQLAMASSAANRAFRNEGGSADVGAVNGAQCPKASQYLLEVAGHTRKHVWLPAW